MRLDPTDHAPVRPSFRFGAGAFCACCSNSTAFAAHLTGVRRRDFLAAAATIAASTASAVTTNGAAQAQVGAGATIYTAKKIISMDSAVRDATAIAVAGGRIAAVGSLDRVKQALGSRDFVVDRRFDGKVVMPGLIEQHLHPILSALSLTSEVIANDDWELPGRTCKAAATPEAFMSRLRAAVERSGNDGFFFAWGYHQLWHGPLARADLDAISSTRPIAVWHRSMHEFYLNTPALDALQITLDSTRGHGLASEQADWPNGHFFERGLDIIMPSLMKKFATPERMVAGLKQMVAYLHRAGVTAINEPGAQVSPDLLKLYQAVLSAETTPFTTTLIVDGRLMYDKHREAGALAATEKTIALAPAGKVRFFSKHIKFFADGAIVSQLMQMKDGYLDGHHGEWMTPPADLKAAFKLYWNAGYQIHTHVTGDLGLELMLDALEENMKASPRTDHRSVVVHFANSTEEQVARIARLGAVVSANPYYVVAFADRYGTHGLGPERADAMTRLGAVARRNIPFSLHSDMPIGPAKPLYNAWAAVNRITQSGRIAAPEQRITVEQALRAVTLDAAQSWRLEHEMGSITPGKVANLAILEDDPLAVDPMKLKDVKIWGTMFEGRVFPV